MRNKMICTPSAHIEVFEFNPSGIETIIIIHGGPGITCYMFAIAKSLSIKYRVLCYNQRGVGHSQALNNSFTLTDYLLDLKQIVKSFRLNTYHLFGHAWGGILAQHFALLYPENTQSMVLCNSFVGTGEDWKNMETEITDYLALRLNNLKLLEIYLLRFMMRIQPLSVLALKRYIKAMLLSYISQLEIGLTSGISSVIKTYPNTAQATRKSILETNSRIPLTLPKIPVFLIRGEHDIIEENHWRLEENWPDAQKVIIKNSGHFPWLEKNSSFITLLKQYYCI